MSDHDKTGHGNAHDANGYAARAARHVPGLHDLHRMAGILLAEHVSAAGRILVLGAGGGMELRAFADMQPGWRFDGVDPSAEMIDQARIELGDQADRVRFHQGYIDAAPEDPFDGATCLLTLHFLPPAERLRTVQALSRRLKPGAPFVVAHHSIPDGAKRDLWLRRNADWLIAGGLDAAQAYAGIPTMKDRLPLLSPQQDEALLVEGGFTDVQLFYAGFTFKGWVCHKA
jgi:tRNA (cmo5U34)-methyltransferase